MKKSIKVLAIVMISFITFLANAQKIGIKGGLNFSNQSLVTKSGESIFDEKEFNLGFNAGLTAGFDFHKNVGVEIGLILNSKGYKLNSDEQLSKIGSGSLSKLKEGFDQLIGADYETTFKKELLYLDIPILLKGMINVTNNTQLYAKFGPYLGIGLTGEEFIDYTKNGERIEDGLKKLKDVKWSDEIDGLKRFDYGLQFGLGTEIYGFLLEANYKLGLANLNNQEAFKTFNHVIGVSIGYNLDFKKLF